MSERFGSLSPSGPTRSSHPTFGADISSFTEFLRTHAPEQLPQAQVDRVGSFAGGADGAGDIPGHGAEGIFVADTRVCSVVRLLVDGAPVEPLAVAAVDASEAAFAGRSGWLNEATGEVSDSP